MGSATKPLPKLFRMKALLIFMLLGAMNLQRGDSSKGDGGHHGRLCPCRDLGRTNRTKLLGLSASLLAGGVAKFLQPLPGPDKFMPMFELDSCSVQDPPEKSNYNVTNHKKGFGTVYSSCVSVTKPFTAIIIIEQIIEAVSEDVVKNDALTITKKLKEEYQLSFKQDIEISSSKKNNIWNWLGIGSAGQVNNAKNVTDKFEEGQKGLDEARKEFSQLLGTHVKSKSKLKAEVGVVGDSKIPTEFCLFFQIEHITFEGGSKLKVVSNDPGTAETATAAGRPAKNTGINGYEVTSL